MKITAAVLLPSLVVANEVWSPDHLPKNHSHLDYKYYGQSPPVYPSPVGNGRSDDSWASAYSRARHLVSQMTLEEKLNFTHGYDGDCTGNTGSVPRLGLRPICLQDGPSGVRGLDFVSAFPTGMHVAATFDRDLMLRYGQAMGAEYRGKGINVALGPMAGPLGRTVVCARLWEGLGSDPYLADAALSNAVTGIQEQGVISTIKHWLLNEQDYRRTETVLGESLSSNVDDRTLHELYAYPFMGAIRDGAGAVMCSYNRANNSHACQNSKLLNGVLKTDLGFEGFVVSDWGAVHSGVATANAGMDMAMPHQEFWGPQLIEAVRNGSVSAERADDMATRILAAWYHAGQDDPNFPKTTAVSSNDDSHPFWTVEESPVDVRSDHHVLIREIANAGTVLLKNEKDALPLKKPKYVSVFGYDAVNDPSPWNNPGTFGSAGFIGLVPEDDPFARQTVYTFNGTLIAAGGSGSTTPPYLIDPFSAIQSRVASYGGIVRWDFYQEKPKVNVNSDVCLVFINAYPQEGLDRSALSDEFSDGLVNHVADNCRGGKTIVVIHSAGVRLTGGFDKNPNVTGIVFAGLPGQEVGNSIVDVLFGDYNPSGKMPFTVAKEEKDYGKLLNFTMNDGDDVWFPQADFEEGLFIDYRHFDREGIDPAYEFGFGLSYTSFSIEVGGAKDLDLDVGLKERGNSGLRKTYLARSGLPDEGIPIVQGGHPQLWDVMVEVEIQVTNTGEVGGAEVPQLYLGVPVEDTPVRQLRGFERVWLEPGQTKEVVFELTRRDLSFWDVVAQEWRVPEGKFGVWVGRSSRDFVWEGSFEM